ncbi:SUN domain-containing ossification factor-like isoform X1 [Salvelinus fontinalis]|uniref:SUN domain-containing ossification factor-like isoform X1 n=1 Tax=Salvelinus fontinalis TaxID=8038 RepID=UPI002485C691|nr:SUN domain-containing ossification factor-like isoform X1 [Salvelinus fontinalis]
MMKKRLWQVVSACLLVLLLCWHPTKYVSCTEQPPEAQTQRLKEDPVDRSHHKLEDGWGSQYVQHLSEEEVLPEGEEVETQQQGLAEEEGAGTPGTEVENKEHVQTLDLDDSEKEPETAEPEAEPETAEPEAEPETAEPEAEPETAEPEAEPETAEPEAEPETAEPEAEPETAEPEAEPETAEPEAEPETAEPEVEPETAEPEAEQPPPEAVVTQELQPTPSSDLFHPSSAPALNPVTEDPSMPHGSSSSVPEDTLSDVPVSEFSDTDLATDDCEAGETNPFDESWTCVSSGSKIQDQSPSLPVVLEKLNNAQGKGTKTDIDPPPAQAGQASVGLAQGANTSHMLKEPGLSSRIATEKDPNVATKDAEDIPTFDEWKKKIMEKEKTLATHISTNGGSHAVKKVQKNFNNYASVECGAKILGSNPEAKSTSAILMESMDHYMLNPCSNKIWFIIELCDPIQVKQLDIANFELFSSTPKDFLVSISDRYPTNKWVKLGTFHAREERTVQSFPLDEHLYAKYVKMFTKYIKVELVSHHGSEHFCPLSLIRVFGTSMVEEYEEIADPLDRPDDQDDDLDYPLGYVPAEDKASNDLIGSAKDVILNMVNNIKVNVLGGGPGEGNFSGHTVNLTVITSSDPDTTTTLSPVPDAVEVEQPEVLEDIDVTTTEEPKPEHVTEEEQVVSPIEEKEEVQSIVTMLEEEEDGREREEHRWPGHRQQESLDYCGLSSSSSCSCSASLQEYLVHQCSFQRNYTSQERKPEATPAPVTPTTPSQQLPISSTPTQTPQQPHTQGEQEREPSSAHEEREARPTDILPWVETEAVGEVEPSMELPHLEPSQTSTLPRPSSTDTSSSAARPTPAVEPPLHSPTDLPGQKHPITGAEKSQEVQQEEIRQPPTVTSSSGPVEQSWGTPVERPCPEVQPVEQDNIPVIHQPHVADPLPPPLLTTSTPTEQQQPPGSPPKPAGAGGGNTTPEEQNSVPVVVMTEPPSHGQGQAVATETKGEAELLEDILFTPSPNGNGQQLPRPDSFQPPSPSPLDFYAELHNATEQGNGNPMHGSTSQKESVFMRLNNRIKALEMNMSLSGRYLEQLSQRYRRQMEEMQRAFNQTIIKLQNTSRMAEEQDQRQTESIHSLQGQLEDVTQLVLNLSVRVSQLQSQVSDRQSYLLLCLVLCLILGLLLCVQQCHMTAMQPPSTDPPITYSYCSPERRFSEYEDMSLKRRASYPLLHSDSFQLPTTEGAETLQTVEPINFPPANKKKRSKMKTVGTLKCTAFCAPLLANRAPIYDGRGTMDPLPRTGHLSHPAFRDPPSEGSSEGSSQSDVSSFCGLAAASCTRLCDGLPPPRSRAEKRAFKPGRVDLLQALRRDGSEATPTILTLQDLIGGEKELAAGRLGVMAL